MFQGTTPTHKFNIPFTVVNPQAVQIIYKQNSKIVLEKQLSDIWITINSNDTSTISVTLTQAETFKFVPNIDVLIQVRIVTSEGTATASQPMKVKVIECLDTNILPKTED